MKRKTVALWILSVILSIGLTYAITNSTWHIHNVIKGVEPLCWEIEPFGVDMTGTNTTIDTNQQTISWSWDFRKGPYQYKDICIHNTGKPLKIKYYLVDFPWDQYDIRLKIITNLGSTIDVWRRSKGYGHIADANRTTTYWKELDYWERMYVRIAIESFTDIPESFTFDLVFYAEPQ